MILLPQYCHSWHGLKFFVVPSFLKSSVWSVNFKLLISGSQIIVYNSKKVQLQPTGLIFAVGKGQLASDSAANSQNLMSLDPFSLLSIKT